MRPTLYLFEDDLDHGVLSLPSREGPVVTVPLTPSETHCFLVLRDAWEKDADVPVIRRGFRRVDWMARVLVHKYDHVGATKDYLHRLMWKVLSKIRKAAAETSGGVTIVTPLERKRIIGARMTPPGLILLRLTPSMD